MTTNRPMALASRPRIRLGLLAVFAATLTACGGGGGGGGDDPPPAPPPPAVELPGIAAAVDLNANQQIGTGRWDDGATATGGLGQTVDGIPCEAPDETYHIHAHLSILLDGQPLAVPADVGLVETAVLDCHYRIHTHDRSGKLHIEGPEPFTATLGQFFAIWGRTLSSDAIADISGKPVVVYIHNGETVTRWDGDPAAIELTSHRHIVVQIGTPVDELPYFTWSSD
jgi:hypothetical protein